MTDFENILIVRVVSTLIAIKEGEVLATVSLIKSSPLGLPCELAYDLTFIKKKRARIAEISALAVHPQFSRQQGVLLWPLLKFMLTYTRRHFPADYFTMVVTPKWFDFYSATWFFRPFLQTKISYAYVKGTTATGGFVKISHLETLAEMQYQKLPLENNFYHYMYELDFPCFQFPERPFLTVNDPVMTPYLLEYFFKQKSSVLVDLSDYEKNLLHHLYDHAEYRRLLPRVTELGFEDIHRGQKRFDMECPAELLTVSDSVLEAQVKSVSTSGIGAIVHRPLRSNEEYVMSVNIGKGLYQAVTVVPVWWNSDGSCGFIISKSTQGWCSFVHALDQRLIKTA